MLQISFTAIDSMEAKLLHNKSHNKNQIGSCLIRINFLLTAKKSVFIAASAPTNGKFRALNTKQKNRMNDKLLQTTSSSNRVIQTRAGVQKRIKEKNKPEKSFMQCVSDNNSNTTEEMHECAQKRFRVGLMR